MEISQKLFGLTKKKTMEYYKNKLSFFFWLMLFAALILSSGSCGSNPSEDRDVYKQGPGCATTELLSEIPSPDGKLRAAVFKYEDTCQKGWNKREVVSVSPNDGSTPNFKPYTMIIYFGSLRPIWTGNKELVIRGESKYDKSYPQYNKNGFFSINVPVSVGETITHKVGWFDGVQVTYQEEKFRIENELVSQSERPSGYVKKGYPLVTKASIYRRKCFRESDNSLVEENLLISLSDEFIKPNLTLRLKCGDVWGDIYKTSIDDQLSLKWLSTKELLIIGAKPEDEKKMLKNEFGWVSVKYQFTKNEKTTIGS